MRIVHLVVGPEQHGVVRHAGQVAGWCGHDVVRASHPAGVTSVPPVDVVHVAFTDRLFGATADEAAVAFARIAALIHASGAALSVTLHDVPHDDSALQRRRRALYRDVVAACRGVVVNSRVELALVQALAAGVHSLRVVALPMVTPPAAARPRTSVPANSVAVLGFVYPDRGYDDVLAALPDDAMLLALGRPAAGHDDLAAHYAARSGARWRLTGYLPDDELAGHLTQVAVPVAPNRRVTASGSINTWIAHGRRPLVADCAYTRELDAARPGTVSRYDPADPTALADAIRHALDTPASTRLAERDQPSTDAADVARAYRAHLAACAPPRARVGRDGRVLLPGNRWDLLDDAPERPPDVSVVIPYYDAQESLDRVLSALARQDHPRDRLEVIVADDGSPQPPDVSAAGGLHVRTLRQPDRGFRAAAARNLGARAASGEILVFLDQDTVPEPGFVRALTRLTAQCPDVVAVGRRRHRDPVDGTELTEPGWLRDAYRDSHDLLAVDRRSYRFVISAVLAVDAHRFADLGGFDERFVGYGGEDWEFAHRARVAGAVLAHAPDAVAWHDGPDWAARGDAGERSEQKRLETARLAELLPDPDARGVGRGRTYPSVVVHAAAMPAADALSTMRSLGDADCGVWFAGLDGDAGAVLAEPGAHVGAPPADVTARAWAQAWLDAPADLGALMSTAEQADALGCVRTPTLTVRSATAVHRARRRAPAGQDPFALADQLFGAHDVGAASC